ncbi:unnamed protein product [Alopecurus aequalis]
MAAAPLDDDDLLSEILLRLPPQPSSLPRASAVSKRWHSLASDPAFSRRFRIHHHRNPPLLGCFMKDDHEFRFESTMESPNRVPRARFPFPIDTGNRRFMVLGCRHGLILMLHVSEGQGGHELMVWDPVNGHEHYLAAPPGFGENTTFNAAVLRDVLRDIHHFQVVLVSTDEQNARVIGCVYSSETSVWGNVISTLLPPNVSNLPPDVIDPSNLITTSVSSLSQTVIDMSRPAVLVGDSIYMLLLGKSAGIVEFNVVRQSLAVIPLPVHSYFNRYYSVMRADGGGLGLLFVSISDCSVQLWRRTTDCDGIASWLLARTIELDKLLPLISQNPSSLLLRAFAEENNVLFLSTFVGVFMVQLDSLQFKTLPEINLPRCHPFEAVYAAGI